MLLAVLLIAVAAGTINALKLNAIQTPSPHHHHHHYHRPPPRREAVVLMTKSVDKKCIIDRVLALAESSHGMKAYRDVWILVDRKSVMKNETMQKLTEAGVNIGIQPTISEALLQSNFHGATSGFTKPSFLEWVTTKPEYDFVWHVEDDSFYTGKWGELFDVCGNTTQGENPAEKIADSTVVGDIRLGDLSNQSEDLDRNEFLLRTYTQMMNRPFNNSADVVATWVLTPNGRWGGWHECYVFGKNCMRAGGNDRLQLMWPVARFSNRFITELKAAIEAGGDMTATQGHHEGLTGNFCLFSSSWCSMSMLPRVGNVQVSGASRAYFDKTKLSVAYVAGQAPPYEIQTSRLYHPVKCAAGGSIGSEALKYAA